MVIHGARRNVEEAEQNVMLQPGDWVFERVTPAGTEPEPTFFNFGELDAIAGHDDMLREICATTPCPVHGGVAKAVRTKWSHNANGDRVVELEIDPPCCEQQDRAVESALQLALHRRIQHAANNAAQFARDVIARSKAAPSTSGAAAVPRRRRE